MRITIKTPPFRSKLTPFLFFFLICLALPGSLFCEEAPRGNEFDKLIQRLVDDGFDREKIEQIFKSKEISFTPETVSLFFIHSESSLDYDQFTSPKAIESALKYMGDNKEILDRAEETFGVDKTVITAILLVETRLGSYLGNRTVINTLSTMAALSDETLRERVWNSIPDEKKPVRAAFIKKARDKTDWGYNELKALLQYTQKEGVAPETIKGSYAGALGVSQFMPSNALNLAKDGDNDGKIDLFNHADAIFSVANYLKHHGWQSGITRQRQHEILFLYNHSNYYVDTLLKISDKLKG